MLSGLLIWWNPAATVFGHEDASALDVAVWVSAALSVVHLVVAWVVMKEPRPTAGSERTRIAHALTEARQTPVVIKSGLVLLGRNRVLMGIVAAEVFWSIGMITFEAFMPLRLEEMVGSAQEAGALVGPVSAAGWGLFSVGAWLAGMTSARVGVARAAIVGRVLNALGAVVMGLVMGPAGLIAAYLFTYSMHGLNGPPHEALLHREAAGEEPLHRAVDQLDDGLPRVRGRRAGPRPDGRPGQPGRRHGDGRCGEHPRGVLLPARPTRREGSQRPPSPDPVGGGNLTR